MKIWEIQEKNKKVDCDTKTKKGDKLLFPFKGNGSKYKNKAKNNNDFYDYLFRASNTYW